MAKIEACFLFLAALIFAPSALAQQNEEDVTYFAGRILVYASGEKGSFLGPPINFSGTIHVNLIDQPNIGFPFETNESGYFFAPVPFTGINFTGISKAEFAILGQKYDQKSSETLPFRAECFGRVCNFNTIFFDVRDDNIISDEVGRRVEFGASQDHSNLQDEDNAVLRGSSWLWAKGFTHNGLGIKEMDIYPMACHLFALIDHKEAKPSCLIQVNRIAASLESVLAGPRKSLLDETLGDEEKERIESGMQSNVARLEIYSELLNLLNAN